MKLSKVKCEVRQYELPVDVVKEWEAAIPKGMRRRIVAAMMVLIARGELPASLIYKLAAIAFQEDEDTIPWDKVKAIFGGVESGRQGSAGTPEPTTAKAKRNPSRVR
jgi:hypothetical protein